MRVAKTVPTSPSSWDLVYSGHFLPRSNNHANTISTVWMNMVSCMDKQYKERKLCSWLRLARILHTFLFILIYQRVRTEIDRSSGSSPNSLIYLRKYGSLTVRLNSIDVWNGFRHCDLALTANQPRQEKPNQTKGKFYRTLGF